MVVGELNGVVGAVAVGVVAADGHELLEGLGPKEEVSLVVIEGEEGD